MILGDPLKVNNVFCANHFHLMFFSQLTIAFNGFPMVLGSFNHWFKWYSCRLQNPLSFELGNNLHLRLYLFLLMFRYRFIIITLFDTSGSVVYFHKGRCYARRRDEFWPIAKTIIFAKRFSFDTFL